ncbi:HAMP domain-containing sensor histidine kinase [Achromobacter seleniivolatilans]|uniref:histidine kinase n=1 Tax=Achromobacter seleniivolatilans TaxID=3047478 RepID=A0ABY9LU63_9BURK|nr:HAMP domain-containing sensor histidine kinase [Achromobacter sp. R39]WMD18293.1 HAMP domain-containing sensor histidine kinase [Achromobacter sp. R39]
MLAALRALVPWVRFSFQEIMKRLLQPCARLGARRNDALLFCNLGIILLCFAMPGGDRPLTTAAPGVLADFGILICLALICVMSGQSQMRIRALAGLIGFWLLAATLVLTARRWAPLVAPVLGCALAYACVVKWRTAAAQAARLGAITNWTEANASPAEAADVPAVPPQDSIAGSDREVMLQMMHDLRSPLSSILAMIEKQNQETAEPRHEEFVDSVRGLVQHSLSVAQDFMFLSRVERLNKAAFLPVSLLDLSREAVDQMLPLAQRKNINIRIRGRVGSAWIAGDYCMLLRALINLLDNALKYSNPSTQITLTVQRKGDLGRISVADQGIGIPDEAIPKLCEAFYQVGQDALRSSEGVGMGLALVKAVSESHGGVVGVESRPDAGSIFSLSFPLISVECHESERVDRRTKYKESLNAII